MLPGPVATSEPEAQRAACRQTFNSEAFMSPEGAMQGQRVMAQRHTAPTGLIQPSLSAIQA